MVLGVVFALSASGNRVRETSKGAIEAPPVIDITDFQQVDDNITAGDRVLVGFASADEDKSLEILRERFSEAARQVQAAGVRSGVRFLVVDAKAVPEATERYGVENLPLVVLFRDGEKVLQKTGLDESSVYAASMVSNEAPSP